LRRSVKVYAQWCLGLQKISW